MKFLSKILANAGLITNYADFDTASTQAGAVGRMVWNNTDGTIDLGLKGGNVTLQLGQEIVARVVNKSGADLLEANYQVVKVSDAQGQRLAVDLAQADNDANSADTLGIVTETINNNQEGFITILGNVNEINTTGSLQGETWVDGDILYLSGTVAGKITNIKPVAPEHLVIVGYVIYAHAIHGKIYTKIQNGYELNELHDVLITTPSNNQVLGYDSATFLWKNASIATWLGYTPYNAASVSGTANRITKFGAGNTLGNGSISDDGSYIYNNAIPFYLTGVNPIRLIGGVGQPDYMTLDQTANSGGKKWRFGHTGAVAGFSSFDFYNETDGTTPLTLAPLGAATFSSSVTATNFISNIATGTAPLTVASTTKVTNLNADLLDGFTAADFYAASSISGTSGTIPLFGASNSLGNSLITQSGSNVTITGNGVVTGNLTVDTNTFFVDSVNNRVGLGTTSPLSGLMHLYGTAGASAVRWSEAAVTVGFVGGANGLVSGKNGSFMVRGEAGLVLSGVGNGNNLYIDSTGDIQTNSATDTGEHFIIGGSARVNGTVTITGAVTGSSTAQFTKLGLGNVPITGVMQRISGSFNEAYSDSATYGILNDVFLSTTPTVYRGFTSAPSTNTGGTLSEVTHFRAAQGAFTGTPALQSGFQVSSLMTGATLNYAFHGLLASATGRWNLYMSGTAANYLAGALGIGTNSLQGSSLTIGKAITGGTTVYNVTNSSTIQSDVTSVAQMYRAEPSTNASAFTISTIVNYQSGFGTKGVGSTITEFIGYNASDSSVATNTYGFKGNIASGTGKWNLYMGGTAANYLAGNLLIGGNTLSTNRKISIEGNITGAVTSYGIDQYVTIASDVTTSMFGYRSNPSTAAAVFTLPDLYHFYANDATVGAGSTITRQYGFYSTIASGTGKWNFYASGTAANYLAGNLQIGSTTTGVARAFIVGDGTLTVLRAQASTTNTPNLMELRDTTATQMFTVSGVGNTTIAGTLGVTGATTLSSTLAVTGNVTVDTNTFFIDASANRVGVGTITPQTKFDVVGGIINSANSTSGFGLGITAALPNGVSGLYHSDGATTGYTYMVTSLGGFRIGVEGRSNVLDIVKTTGAATFSSTVTSTGVAAGSVSGLSYANLSALNTSYGATANLLALGTFDGTYNPRVIVSYTTSVGNPALLKFASTYSSGWGATNYSFESGIFMIGSATAVGTAALQVTGAITGSSSLTIGGSFTSAIASAGIANVIGYFNNTDYTATNKSAIRVRQQTGVATGYSAYLGVDRDTQSVFLSNDTMATAHLSIATTGAITTSSSITANANSIINGTAQVFKINGSSSYTELALFNSTVTSTYRNWSLLTNGFAAGDLNFNVSAAQGGNPLSGTYAVTFKGNGNVLIGTTTDNNSKLQVAGAATISTSLLLGTSLTLTASPTASAGAYEILTRNTSTGVVEKIASSAYIQNQIASAQTANMWISGDAKVNGKVYVGTHGAYVEEFYDGTVYKLKIVDSAGNDIIL